MNEEQKIQDLSGNNASGTNTGEIDHEKLWAISAYFIFFLPMIFVKNRSQFLNYHINQGIILCVVSLAGSFGFGILPGWMGILPSKIWQLLVFALLVVGVINVIKREMKPLPVIGKLFNFLK
jgi:uncharacterized membrane protein